MNPEFLEVLCCPETGSDLKLEITETFLGGTVKSGWLIAQHGGHRYPIVRGIPRFVEQELYTKSFGYEWRKWSRVQFESENERTPMQGHTKRMFAEATGFSGQDLENRLVVEFGCGPGRFLDMVRQSGGRAVGIDLSAAVESARENFQDDPNVLIVQGDVLDPPFKKNSFDVGYSIGVLHHTPDPAKGFKALVEIVKPNGLVACCVYPEGGFYDLASVATYRHAHNATKKLFGTKAALGYSYFSAYCLYPLFSRLHCIPALEHWIDIAEHKLFVNVHIPDAKWRVLDNFDAITPVYAFTHTAEEVDRWFTEAGCRDIRQTPWCATSFVGIKGDG